MLFDGGCNERQLNLDLEAAGFSLANEYRTIFRYDSLPQVAAHAFVIRDADAASKIWKMADAVTVVSLIGLSRRLTTDEIQAARAVVDKRMGSTA
jgi:hypothetical protein